MVSVAELIVKITADAKDAQAGIDQTAGKASKMAGGIRKAAAPAAAALIAVGAGAMKAVDAASKTQQAYGALDSIFGKNAAQMKQWSEGAATSVGLASSEYAELASVIGAQLKNAGVPMSKIGDQTDALIRQGADLAATFGGTTAEAVGALSSALKGETDPIERYGVSVKQADIAARQAAEGTSKLEGEAGKAAKTTALLGLVNEQTADSVGAFAKESDSAAGASQIAQAQYENLMSTLGTALLPVVSTLMGMVGGLATVMTENAGATQIVIGVIAALAAGILVLNVALSVYTTITKTIAIVSKIAWLSALGPIALVIVAVGLVVAAIVILWRKSETFRSIVLAVWGAIKSAATTAADVIKRVFTGAFDIAERAVKGFLTAAAAVWAGIRSAVSSVASFLSSAFADAFGAIRSAVTAVGHFIAAAFKTAQGAVSAVWSAISGFVATAAGRIMDILRDLPGKIKGAFTGAATLLTDIGRSIIEGLGAGIDAAKDWLMGKINAIADSIPGWLKRRLGIASPSKVTAEIGRQIMQGLGFGIEEMAPEVEATAKAVADGVAASITKAFERAALADLPKNTTDAQRTKAIEKAGQRALTLSNKVLATLADEYVAINLNTQARAKNGEELKKQSDKLTQLISQQDSYADSVRGSAASFAALTTATVEEGESFNAADMIKNMSDRITAVNDFRTTLDELRAMGLSEATLADLTAAGVETGGAMAAALAAGGPEAVAEVTALQGQLDAASTTLGTNAAAGMYGAGVAAQQALVSGLEVDQAVLEAEALTLATALATAVDKAVREADVQATAEAYAKRLAKAIRKALRDELDKGGNGGGGGGGNNRSAFLAPVVPITSAASASKAPRVPSAQATTSSGPAVHVTVNGALDPEATARQIRRILAGHDRRVGLIT